MLRDFVRRGYRQRLFISTQGTFSARLDDELVPDHPAPRRPRRRSRAADLVLVADGRAEAGRSPSRASRIHAAIYRRHPEVGAIVNAAR